MMDYKGSYRVFNVQPDKHNEDVTEFLNVIVITFNIDVADEAICDMID